MEEKVKKLVLKYKNLLKHGEDNLKELDPFRPMSPEAFLRQKLLNSIWRMVIKDFEVLSDELNYDLKKEKD